MAVFLAPPAFLLSLNLAPKAASNPKSVGRSDCMFKRLGWIVSNLIAFYVQISGQSSGNQRLCNIKVRPGASHLSSASNIPGAVALLSGLQQLHSRETFLKESKVSPK